MIAPTVTLDTSQFDRYTRALSARLDPRNPRGFLTRVIRSEAASVIKVAASKARPASATKIRADRRFNALRRIDDGTSVISINSGKRGGEKHRVWYGVRDGKKRSKGGRTWYPLGTWNRGKSFNGGPWRLTNRRWTDARRLWRNEQAEADTAVESALRSRGLSMQGWVQIIDAIGLPLEMVPPKSAIVPPFARTATNRAGRQIPTTGRATELTSPGGFLLETVNTSTVAMRTGAKRHIEAAIRIRRSAFTNALRAGLFDDAEALARAYPGITVRP